ncbi:alpha-1,6-mannosyltransferase subunit [Coprinellus micaceus]|uniref:Mannosyltransferase n=1 Tax=Coprinellus micaceus TaxID=71717 RepID=A0A4Y7TH14_COPMI|nr:alpha-1,6-mannosyltransferase subunit [Coprinellus micaceus]
MSSSTIMDLALDGLVLVTAWLHTIASPYAKVEESFNLHAVHDVLMYGVGVKDLDKYDHFVFSGAVPRTFIGSVLLAWVATPALHLASFLGFLDNKFDVQVIVRLTLATLNSLGLCLVRHAVSKHFGRKMGVYYTLITCSQFHVPFWIGRTIPNMFALFFVNISTYIFLNRPPRQRPSETRVSATVAVLTFAAAVFRGELALYLAPLCLFELTSRHISLTQLLKVGVVSGLVSATLTISIDSYFWQQPLLWPEFSGIFFNVVQGKSSEWGVSPPFTYFTSFLPKLLLSALPLSVIGIARSPQTIAFVSPAFRFVALISFLGHKEWRFIVYVVPIFNVAAARGLYFLLSPKRKKRSPTRQKGIGDRIGFLVGISSIIVNLAFTLLSSYISAANYPGGEAMRRFHTLYNPQTVDSPVHVHISNLAAQTGASLFTQQNSLPQWHSDSGVSQNQWVYNKTEGLSLDYLMSTDSPFTHLILEELPPQKVLDRKGWRVVSAINALDRVMIQPRLLKGALRSFTKSPSLATLANAFTNVVKVEQPEKVWIAERS